MKTLSLSLMIMGDTVKATNFICSLLNCSDTLHKHVQSNQAKLLSRLIFTDVSVHIRRNSELLCNTNVYMKHTYHHMMLRNRVQ